MTAPSPVRRPAGRPAAAARLLALADYGFAFFVFVIASNAFTFLGVQSKLWILAYGYFFMRAALCFSAFSAFISRNLVFLAYPAICVISLLWSVAPGETARFSAQLLVSVLIGLFIGMRLSMREVFHILMLALLVLMAFSLLNLLVNFADAYDKRGNFLGIFLSKNAFGHRAVLFAVGSVFMVFLLRGIHYAQRLVYLLALFGTGYMVTISGSATAAAVSVAMGLTAAAAHLAVKRRGALALIATGAGAAVIAAGIAIVALQIDPFESTLSLLGRNATLTGRTVLWEFGWTAYLSHPLLGFGAGAFWASPLFTSDIISVQSSYGETVKAFHNIVIELLVLGGPLAVAAHGAAGYVTLRRSFALIAMKRSSIAVWALVTTAALYGMAFFGAQMVGQHAIPLILMVAIGSSLSKQATVARRS